MSKLCLCSFCQPGGASGTQHATVLQAVRIGKGGAHPGDMALLLRLGQVNYETDKL